MTKRRPAGPAMQLCKLCGEYFVQKPVGPKAQRCRPCSAEYSRVQMAAARKVRYAVGNGTIPAARELDCVDCLAHGRTRKANVYDHRSYLRPLDVEPVCHYHNAHRGPAEWAGPTVAPISGRYCYEPAPL